MNVIFSDSLMKEFNWMSLRGSKRAIKDCRIISVIYGKFNRLFDDNMFKYSISSCDHEYLKRYF